MNSNIIDIATCKTCNVWTLDAEEMILIEYYYQIAKASAIYVFTDGPAGQPT